MAEVILKNVSKAYQEHQIIRDLSIRVNDGECFTFLGPSGCGKTVILRLIAGFEALDAGEIRIGDTLVASAASKLSLPPEMRKIGVVFQDYAVWPHKTVYENVFYPLFIQKIPRNDAHDRTIRAIRQVGLENLEHRLPYQLSGGQQQRVALARALVCQPQIMLLDEPLSNLDANLREEMRFELKELQRKTGVTILYVTHDQEVALAISDRMAIMDQQGTIRQVGTSEQIYEQPADSFVFRFMGISNFIPVIASDGQIKVEGSDLLLTGVAPPDRPYRRPVIGCRPMDIELTRQAAGIPGKIRRMALLGPIIDYHVEIGGRLIRVQEDTQEAVARSSLFGVGDDCQLSLGNIQWFEGNSLEEGVA